MGNMQQMSRRDFTKGGLFATAAGGLGLMAGSAKANEAAGTRPGAPEQWDAEADAVIIGYGPAGATAAIDLADAGLTSVLLEKMDREHAGGDCAVCGGYILVGGDRTVEQYIVSTLNGVSREFAEVAVPRLNAAPDYMRGLGIEIGTDMPVVVAPEGTPRGQALYHGFEAAVDQRSDKITVMYETPGIALVQDPVTKEVLGVKAGSEDAPIYVKANRGVLVATGSYGADREMTNRIHEPGLLFPTVGSPANTGDGLKMLLEAGCKAQNFGKSLEYDAMAVRVPSDEVGTGLTLQSYPNASSFIFVNREGNRFMDETATLQHSKNDYVFQYNEFIGQNRSDQANTGYPNSPAFMVFDQAMLEAGPIVNVNGGGMGWNIFGLYTWSDTNEAEVEKGWIVKADTLEELAEKCSAVDMWGNTVGVDAAGLVASVEQFNAACEAGEDADFNRSSGAMVPIGDGPYYAIEVIPATLYTTGGATHDINAQAVNWNDQPIPRLYLAGLVGDPFTVHSTAVAGCVMWGRVAAESIAQLEVWE